MPGFKYARALNIRNFRLIYHRVLNMYRDAVMEVF